MTTNFVSLLTDSTTVAGTGNVTTNGAAATGYKLLADIGPVGTKFDYRIGAPGAAEWEEGEGKVLSATSFSRTPLDSSNNNGLVNFSAGTKPVTHAVIASRMRKLHARTSPKCLYLSAFCESDTILDPYAPVAGVDQRAAIQAVLDIPNVQVIGDIKATVANVPGTNYPGTDADTLLQRSNTVVLWLPGCGLLQAAGSKGDMWKNGSPTTNANNNHASITDENIGLIGGIFHGNRDAQNNVKMDVLRFSGVRNLYTAEYTVYRASGMGVRVINIDGWVNRDYTVDQGKDILTASNAVFVNTDGVHVHGPARGIRDTNGRILNCGDDSYALNADDAWAVPNVNFIGRFDNVRGDITDVIVSSLHFDARIFGIRILSGNSRVDRVFFLNTTGSTTGSAFRTDNYLNPSYTRAAGPGNCGLIVVDGWNVTTGMADFSWGQMAMLFDCRIEQLVLKRIVKRDFNNAYFPAIRFGEKYQGDQLDVDYMSRNYNGGTYLADQIDFATGAQVTQADIKVRAYASSSTSGYPVRIRSGVSIAQAEVRGGQINFTGMVANESSSTAAFVDNSKASMAVAAPSTWVLQSASPWSQDTSNPGNLTLTSNHSGVVDSARKIASDTFSGNARMNGKVRFNGTAVTGAMHIAFVLRGANTVPWSGVTQGYAFDMFLESGGGIKPFKISVGSQPSLATPLVVPFALNTDYLPDFTVKGSTITLLLQRGSDSMYLQPNGSWAATATPAFSVTDTSIAAASGEIAVYAFNDHDPSSTIVFTNLSVTAAP